MPGLQLRRREAGSALSASFRSGRSIAHPQLPVRRSPAPFIQEWWREKIPIDFEEFEVKQVWYVSKDGTRVPMYLFHRRDIELDGNRATLLVGYGGFNESFTPFFWPGAFWVALGGVFAVPNLRGGGEFGEKWHAAGREEANRV